MRMFLVWLWRLWVLGGAVAFLAWKGPGDAFVWLILWCGIAHMAVFVAGLLGRGIRRIRGAPSRRSPWEQAPSTGDGFDWLAVMPWVGRAKAEAEAARARESDLQARLESSQHLVRQLQDRNSILESETRTHLQATERLIAALEQRNAWLEGELAEAAFASGAGHPLFRRVGLDARCPEWVAVAVRREYRKRFHPDLHSGANKDKAEQAFKEAEGVFDKIWVRRGFK